MRKYLSALMCGCFISLVASCAPAPVTESGRQQMAKPVSCIAVLPARSGESEEISKVGGLVTNVQTGASYADTVLRQELAGQPNVKMVSGETMGSLATAVTDAGKATGCEGVMVTSVYKFRQREGSGMAAAEPASTAFDIRIYDAETRNVLWAADFSETQEPLLSNIFSFGKAKSRGFKWITVEELMEQGLKERLGACPYLKND